MNAIKKELKNLILCRKWVHNIRYIGSNKNIEQCLDGMKAKGNSVNILSLVISNNNLCYCLLKNKNIKKIGLINIKKDSYSYDSNLLSSKKEKKNNRENNNLNYNYDKEESPLSFNIKEILTVLNFIKLYSNKQDDSNKEYAQRQNEMDISNTQNEHNILKNDKSEIHQKGNKNVEEKKCDNGNQTSKNNNTEQWVIGIEKINEKYEKNKIKEKIMSIIVYFLQSIFKCKIVFLCPKEARKYFSIKCNHNLNNREETYTFIKNKIKNFPSIENNNNSNINFLFSDAYVISFYTYRYYMHDIIKNNRLIFNYLEKEVKRNKSFNHILQTLKRTQNEQNKMDLTDLLKNKINRIVENEAYKLVDKYFI
ncbi:conserved Plasmodium protein, unknown function [Plasmodium berghei]|uniref:Uncharacterized protein n=2 Tax=Plasmodium berghei TaxID=5821 RepID=A0A509AQK5_PLABA|nr:conserved Plasmodium protein, unknown function [Plasmodium berghei ANKA]CXJ01090.1 conserved Plasmodium protein, unknown function [Plasmodium berghei]SCL98119.1 conserved Plasmodium protein, unknown function [Plasmodium berghei]SCM16755.1 conserved Plasmodium protein, unknown function [Plasmodium berghei]SCM18553.1 conserved Plasmodium protein, unknown function [Plasmodium berghei]SCN27986.1 conserved Plasmodium protein, unknown function [Plasmodium berghei]|eukprot:XP_034423639.1 conserved Plasmodium protein, unknown function [Plasmodium berghei ANKA]